MADYKVVDIHGHLNSPPELMAFKAGLLSSRIHRKRGSLAISDERMRPVVDNHVKRMDGVGTDIQFLSPRPFQLMHSDPLPSIVEDFCKANNDAIKQSVDYYPDRYRGVCGLPQVWGEPVSIVFEEMERCVKDMGFVGVMIDPDPSEGQDPNMPPMGDEYWYPLYEKMIELDVPALIHTASCRNIRETYSNHFITEEGIAIMSLMDHNTLDTFPDLKIIVCHGGGSVPYQIGRWRAHRWREKNVESFDESLRKLYFDAVLYNKESLDLLFQICGTDRCMFGTENPGSGSSQNPETGEWLDDLKPVIESIDWLTDQDRKNVFEDTAKKAFPRFSIA